MNQRESAGQRLHRRTQRRSRAAARRRGGDRQFRRRAPRPPGGDRRGARARPRARPQSGGADLRAASAPVLPAAAGAVPALRRARQAPAPGRHRARRRHRPDLRRGARRDLGGGFRRRAILVDRFAIGGAAIGFDFHFGKNRAGSPEFLARRARGSALRSTSCRRWITTAGGCRPARCAARSAKARWWRRPSFWARPGSSPARWCTATSAAASLAFPPPISGSIRPAASSTASTRCAWASAGSAMTASRISAVRPMFDNGALLLEVFLFDFDGDALWPDRRRRLHRLDPAGT